MRNLFIVSILIVLIITGGAVWLYNSAEGGGETPQWSTVQAGISDGVVTEITSGLNPGDTVVYLKGEAQSRWRAERSRQGLSSGRGMRMMMGGGRSR